MTGVLYTYIYIYLYNMQIVSIAPCIKIFPKVEKIDPDGSEMHYYSRLV